MTIWGCATANRRPWIYPRVNSISDPVWIRSSINSTSFFSMYPRCRSQPGVRISSENRCMSWTHFSRSPSGSRSLMAIVQPASLLVRARGARLHALGSHRRGPWRPLRLGALLGVARLLAHGRGLAGLAPLALELLGEDHHLLLLLLQLEGLGDMPLEELADLGAQDRVLDRLLVDLEVHVHVLAHRRGDVLPGREDLEFLRRAEDDGDVLQVVLGVLAVRFVEVQVALADRLLADDPRLDADRVERGLHHHGGVVSHLVPVHRLGRADQAE